MKEIILIEDNPDEVKLILRAFKTNRIENPIVSLTSGHEAMGYLLGEGKYRDRDLLEPPAFILLDLELDTQSGLEVLRTIRSHVITRLYPVIILTASSDDNNIIAGYSLGVNSYIRKPVDYDQFTEIVKQISSYWLHINEPPLRELKF
jgi:two-component system, response regulator